MCQAISTVPGNEAVIAMLALLLSAMTSRACPELPWACHGLALRPGLELELELGMGRLGLRAKNKVLQASGVQYCKTYGVNS